MMTSDTLNKLRELLIERQVTDDERHDAEIQRHLLHIFEVIAASEYEEGKLLRSSLFSLSDEFHDLFFATLYLILQRQLALTINLPRVSVPTRLHASVDSQTINQFILDLMYSYVPRNSSIRLSSVTIPESAIPEDFRESLVSFIVSVAQHDEKYFQLDREDLQGTMITLSVGRQIALIAQRVDLYYAALGVVVERLNAAQEYQLGRDFAEEVLATSMLDGKPEWGHYALFTAFNGQSSVNMALIYANACVAVLILRQSLQDLIFNRLLFSLQRLYRNIYFLEQAENLYKFMLDNLELGPSDLFTVTSTHFSTKIIEKDSAVVLEVYQYITNNREFVFQGGRSVALPLLTTIYNLKLMFSSHPELELFDSYIPLLESIVGKEDAERLRSLIYGDSDRLKQVFIEMLAKLRRTRSADDLVSEVRQALVAADRLIGFSFNRQDVNAFLLAMILKSDYSLVFQEDFSSVEHGFVRVVLNQQDNEVTADKYDHYAKQVSEQVALGDDDQCLWLAESGNKLFSLELRGRDYSSIKNLTSWNMDVMNDWLSWGFTDLAFDETRVSRGQVEQYLDEDQARDLEKVQDAVKFTSVDIDPSGTLLLVKDMELSAMPHNLILDLEGEFISRKVPVTCLPSVEWYFEQGSGKSLNPNFTRRLWIPTEGGDYTLNLLWSRLEDSLGGLDVEVTHQEMPREPLSGDVNVLSAHGASDISAFPAFFTKDGAAVLSLDRIVGEGQVLVLLVCHSGAMEKDILRQKILSLIRKFLSEGYQAVVAPFWSLHISIPPLWLPKFLTALKDRKTVAEAVFEANNHVYELNKNPGAWACMHLYGSPYIRIT